MAICGSIILEDVVITFNQTQDENLTIEFVVVDTHTGRQERRVAPQAAFLSALAIAVHNDGTPDYRVDYPAAESVMGDTRWIP